MTCMKEMGDPRGGRIFVCRGIAGDPSNTIRFLEETPVLVEDIPMPDGSARGNRLDGIKRELDAIRTSGLWRTTRVLDTRQGGCAMAGGHEVAVLSSNDYLGLAQDPRVKKAAADAAQGFGAGTGGARLTTGTQPLHVKLEERLAAFFGSEAAVSYATGYMANVGVISALAGKGDVILSDELNHASIIDGCRLSGADVIVYRHRDMDDLAGKLSRCGSYRRRLVVSDGVFSMDGDIAPLPTILDLCSQYDAFSFIDDAHAVGVLGATGRGTAEHFGCPRADLTVGTLSKALGSEGGFVAGTGAYTAGTKLTLTAEARPGWTFTGWSVYGSEGILSDKAKYQVVVDGDAEYCATFEPQPYIFAVAIPGDGGKVSGSGYCPAGKKVTLKATAGKGFRFVAWCDEDGDFVADTASLVVDRTVMKSWKENGGASGAGYLDGDEEGHRRRCTGSQTAVQLRRRRGTVGKGRLPHVRRLLLVRRLVLAQRGVGTGFDERHALRQWLGDA